jgi:hypothetical protein
MIVIQNKLETNMKKKTLIIIGIVIVVLVALMFLFRKYTKSHSPAATANYTENGLVIDISYCRPYKKGRLIFGEESEGALQPYGKYWRVGANEATTFNTNKDLMVNGKELKAGKYQLYAIPGKDSWQVVFNSEWDRWGAQEANHKTDVLQTELPADHTAPPVEQLLISFDEPDSAHATNLRIHWDNTLVKVPVSAK